MPTHGFSKFPKILTLTNTETTGLTLYTSSALAATCTLLLEGLRNAKDGLAQVFAIRGRPFIENASKT